MPRRRDDDPELAARLIIGGIAGFVATMALTATMARLQRKLPGKMAAPVPSNRAPGFGLAITFAYGAACGALLAAASPRVGRVAGSAAGAGLWLAGQMGWLPPLGVAGPRAGDSLRFRFAHLGAHLAWGWSTAEAIRELGEAGAPTFARGTDSDGPGRG